jgi:hypothetical protein
VPRHNAVLLLAMPKLQLLSVFILAASTGAAQVPATAQVPAPQETDWNVVKSLPPGTQLRIDAAPRRVTGALQSVTADSVVLRSAAGEETVMRSQVARIAMKKTGHRGRHALIGLAIGGGTGTVLAIAAASCKGFGCIGATAFEIAAPIACALVGTLVGAVIPAGGWREIYHAPAPAKTP